MMTLTGRQTQGTVSPAAADVVTTSLSDVLDDDTVRTNISSSIYS